jgi:hypothetical protein
MRLTTFMSGVGGGVASCPIAWDAGKLRRHSRRAGRKRLLPAGTDRRNEIGI